MENERRDRIAKNEVVFRDVNERVKQIGDASGDPTNELATFLCECGDAQCLERIGMLPSEYEEVRASPVYFAVVPGHEQPEVERIVRKERRFYILEKLPGEQAVARENDPRGGE
jgi:hypothetical protein